MRATEDNSFAPGPEVTTWKDFVSLSKTCRRMYYGMKASIYTLNKTLDASSALRISAKIGSLEGVRTALQYNLCPSPSAWTGSGWFGAPSLRWISLCQDDVPALHWAAWRGNMEMMTLLLQAGANASSTVLARRVAESTADAVLSESLLDLLDEDADLFGYAKSTSDKVSALYLAVDAGHEDACKLLICAGGNLVINETTRLHVMHKVCRHVLLNTLQFMLRTSPLVFTVIDAAGNTPMHHAMVNPIAGTPQVVNALIQAGALLSVSNYKGETPLDFGLCAMETRWNAAQKLLDKEAVQQSQSVWAQATVLLLSHGAVFFVSSMDRVKTMLPRRYWHLLKDASFVWTRDYRYTTRWPQHWRRGAAASRKRSYYSR